MTCVRILALDVYTLVDLHERNITQLFRGDIMMGLIFPPLAPFLVFDPDQRLNVWAPMFIVVTVKTLLSDVLRPVEVASFRANVLANVASAAFSVIVVSVYSEDSGQLSRHTRAQPTEDSLCAATVLSHACA